MTTITEPTTVRHNVGTCPACHAYLWAEVDIAVKVNPPTLARDGKAHVYASPHFLGMRVEHYCARDEDGEWTEIAASRPETAPRTDAEASEAPEGHRDAENGTEGEK